MAYTNWSEKEKRQLPLDHNELFCAVVLFSKEESNIKRVSDWKKRGRETDKWMNELLKEWGGK